MRKKKEFEENLIYGQDENFSFIAGYTDGGIPFGITWEEQEEIDRMEEKKKLIGIKHKVELEKVIEAMEFANHETRHYYYKKTGEIIAVTDEDERFADGADLDNLEIFNDWDREIIEMVIDIECNFEDYILLPDKYDISEYEIMTDFAYSIDDNKKMNEILKSLDGKGAFRKFKTKVISLGLEKRWYEFRDKKYKEIAIEWCNNNNLTYL